MKEFSNSERLAPAAVRPGNQAARIQALAEEYETKSLIGKLDEAYRAADSLADGRGECRKCARCCDQTIRPLAAYAVEIAYLAGNTAAENIPLVDEDERLCPALGPENSCKFYLKRPLGCRLFLPCEDWAQTRGCANYPHGPESIGKMHHLLRFVEGLNEEFVRTVGLHRDFDFDYLAHWSITTWFSPIAVAAAEPGLSWGL